MNHDDFDEVMIVNPSPFGFDPTHGEEDMTYLGGHWADGDGDFADDYLADDLDEWYGADIDESEWAGADGYGYACAYGDPYAPVGGFAGPYGLPMGWYGAPVAYGYAPFAYSSPEMNGYGWGGYEAPLAAYIEDDPDADYAYGYPEDDYDEYDYGEDDYDEYAYADEGLYGYDDIGGYVRETPPSFNPVVTAATHLGDGFAGYDGYTRPESVSAMCTGLVQPTLPASGLPATLTPLW